MTRNAIQTIIFSISVVLQCRLRENSTALSVVNELQNVDFLHAVDNQAICLCEKQPLVFTVPIESEIIKTIGAFTRTLREFYTDNDILRDMSIIFAHEKFKKAIENSM